MPIKLIKDTKTVICNEFVETDSDTTINNAVGTSKYPFSKLNGEYKIYEKELEENSSATKIVFNRSSKKLSAKNLQEYGIYLRAIRSIIPQFEISNNKIYMSQATLQAYNQSGLATSSIVIGINVKHATFSRGQYKKSKTKRRLYSKHWNGSTNNRWKDIRSRNGGVSPYQRNENGKPLQHSGKQWRKHVSAIRLGKKAMLLTRPARYFYSTDPKAAYYSTNPSASAPFFTHLTINANREVIFTIGNNSYNAYEYFRVHKMSIQDKGGKNGNHTWLQYNFSVKSRSDGPLQNSDFLTVTYDTNRNMTGISF